MLFSVGITFEGEKVFLGFVQTATENERGCAAFLRGLVARGLWTQQVLLCVTDGENGIDSVTLSPAVASRSPASRPKAS